MGIDLLIAASALNVRIYYRGKECVIRFLNCVYWMFNCVLCRSR